MGKNLSANFATIQAFFVKNANLSANDSLVALFHFCPLMSFFAIL
jgi:hypothetical protein